MAKAKKKKKKGGVVQAIALIILLGCLAVLVNEFYKYMKVRKSADELREIFYADGNFSIESFDDLLAINPDTIGWLSVPNTHMDLVVVKRSGDDGDGNTYYLDKDFFGEQSKAGTLFMDYRNVVTKNKISDNLIIYGHNQMDKTMMGDLKEFKHIDFYKENPTFKFMTEYGESDYKIFACFITDDNASSNERFDYHNYLDFESEAQFNQFMDDVLARSYYFTGTEVEYGDKLITLSSCSTEFSNSRFVVMARKVRKGESSDVDVSVAVKNNDIKYPSIWYDLYG